MPIFQIRVEHSELDQPLQETTPPPVEEPKATRERTLEIEADSVEEAKDKLLTEIRKLVPRGKLEVVSVVEMNAAAIEDANPAAEIENG